jgi:hypothetical protein
VPGGPPAPAHPVAQEPEAAAGVPAVLLPGDARGGLLVTEERVYIPDALGHGVGVVDHRRGRRLGTVPAGRGPLALPAASAPGPALALGAD